MDTKIGAISTDIDIEFPAINNRNKRDGETHHITVITQAEMPQAIDVTIANFKVLRICVLNLIYFRLFHCFVLSWNFHGNNCFFYIQFWPLFWSCVVAVYAVKN